MGMPTLLCKPNFPGLFISLFEKARETVYGYSDYELQYKFN